MMGLIAWVQEKNPLPPGTVVVGTGLAVSGVTSSAFLVITGNRLGPIEFGSLFLLWTMVFLIGPGFFLPLQQEVGRALAARRVLGLAGGAVIRRAALLGAGLTAVLAVLCLLASRLLIDRLFNGDVTLLAGLIVAIFGYCVFNLVLGAMSGSDRWSRYAAYFGGEAAMRLVWALVCVAVGVTTAGPIGLSLGVCPLIVGALIMTRQGDLLEPGPPAPWKELVASLGALLAGSALAQLLVNAGPVLIGLLASADDRAEVGKFTAALIIARIPLFLFQAVQAALLPRLSAVAAAGRLDDFKAGLGRLTMAIGGVALLGTLGGFAVGPAIVERLFGSGYAGIPNRTMGLLALGTGVYVLAMVLSQATIALGGARHAAIGWAVGVATMPLVVAVVPGLLDRVALGYVAGAVVSSVAMAVLLRTLLRRGAQPSEADLREALLHAPFE
jgi:O-antigen/teichoic acid export membrane protein